MQSQAYFDNLTSQVIQELETATHSILISVPLLTDPEIFESLCGKALENVRVELLLSNDRRNIKSGINYDELRNHGATVVFVGSGWDIVVIITALISLGVGFGGGWMFSRHSAQTPREQSATPPSHSVTAQKQAADGSVPPNPTTARGGQQTDDPPLDFYKMLPHGQTNTALGSGINSKDDKPAKPPSPAAPATRTDANGSRQ